MKRTAWAPAGLAVLLFASALLLVHTSYESRRLFADIERAQALEQRLETEYQRLEAERQAAATHLRVERLAREKLQMRPATPAVTFRVGEVAR